MLRPLCWSLTQIRLLVLKIKSDNKLLYLYAFLSIVFISCSGKPPVVHQVEWKHIFIVKSDKIIHSFLSVFVNVSDEDGPKDIVSLYIIRDKAELFWKYDTDSWSEKKIGTERWIGSNRISMPDSESFPSGIYRIIVIDTGGERDEKEIYIPSENISQKLPSLLIKKDDTFNIQSPFSDNYLQLRTAGNKIVKILKVSPGTLSEKLILKGIKEKIPVFDLYAEDVSTNSGYIVSVQKKVFQK